MGLFTLEHGKTAYRADIGMYGAAVIALAVLVRLVGPVEQQLEMAGFVLLGLGSWTGVEYALHRFVLHGLRPFSGWHAQHHARPTALICTPTLLSALLITAFVFIPAWLLTGLWRACALTLGVLIGYLAYTVTHHATHHWRADGAWLRQRKRWHALHHHHVDRPVCYGVTSSFWDRVFGSTPEPARPDGQH